MKILKKLFLSFSIIIVLIIFSYKVNALEIMSREAFEYIIEQTSPEDLDLSLKNGTIYSDKYLKEMKEFDERLQKSIDKNNKYRINEKDIYCGITDVNQVYYMISIIFYVSTMK